nr:NAD-dependent epimerase/dehydratase family protein [Bradyrhizobium sp. CCBAU 53340]
MREDSVLSGPLEPTNEPYAIAKIAGIKMAEAYRSQYGSDFISVMPTNLYDPGDNYHPELSHVVAVLVRRFHEAKLSGAKTVAVWGTGTPRREFLYVDDMAGACVHLMKTYSGRDLINIGTGEDIAIAEFARWSPRSSATAARSVTTPWSGRHAAQAARYHEARQARLARRRRFRMAYAYLAPS